MVHYVYHKAEADTATFILNIEVDLCSIATLTIDSSILTATIINHEITATVAHTETFNLASPQVTSSESAANCPNPYIISVINQDDSAIES